jgi:hypothetical protein
VPVDPRGREIIRLVEEFMRRADEADAEVLGRLVAHYGQLSRRLQDMIARVAAEAAEGALTPAQLERSVRYRSLLRGVAEELGRFEGTTARELTGSIEASLARGTADSRTVSELILGEYGLRGKFHEFSPRQAQSILAFTQPGGPLYARLEELTPFTADRVASGIAQGVSLGFSPSKVAGLINSSLGQGLTSALQMVRTAQLWSYREASRLNYLENDHIVGGWIWWAELDGTTCMACVEQHGTVHELDEVLDDHHNGRCTELPLPAGSNPSEFVEQTGEEWFRNQPEEQQRAQMGPQFHEAWQGGNFSLSDLVGSYQDSVYGEMLGNPTLAELLGG